MHIFNASQCLFHVRLILGVWKLLVVLGVSVTISIKGE